ncbi:MAG TPA: hypothetical protein DIW23_13815 [Anaerolineae bacterium]|nr:hypothetical protein [Anaerolineae bacterium]
MDNRLTQDSLIEDALKTYDLVEMPQSITTNVMSRIQKDVRPTLVTWNDFVLSFVIALCIGALYFTVLNLPPIMLAKIKIQSILLYQSFLVNADWLIPVTLFGIAAFLSALTIPYLGRQLKS